MGEHATVRAPKATRDTLERLALEQGLTVQEVLEQAVETYRRQAFFARLNRDLAAQGSPIPTEVEDEQALWDQTLADGLPTEERWLFDDDSRAHVMASST